MTHVENKTDLAFFSSHAPMIFKQMLALLRGMGDSLVYPCPHSQKPDLAFFCHVPIWQQRKHDFLRGCSPNSRPADFLSAAEVMTLPEFTCAVHKMVDLALEVQSISFGSILVLGVLLVSPFFCFYFGGVETSLIAALLVSSFPSKKTRQGEPFAV